MTAVEKIHNLLKRGDGSQVIDFVGDKQILFNSLISIYIEGPYRTTQMAAGPLTAIASKKPALLRPHFRRLINSLNDPAASTALKRNTIRMFQFVTIPSNRHGEVIEVCFNFLLSKKETIAVKVFAMTVVEILTRKRTEIRRELQIVIEDQLPYAGPAFRSRASRVLKQI